MVMLMLQGCGVREGPSTSATTPAQHAAAHEPQPRATPDRACASACCPSPCHMSQSVAWQEPVVSGQGPCARSGHTLTAAGGKLWLFGGTGRLDGACARAAVGCWCSCMQSATTNQSRSSRDPRCCARHAPSCTGKAQSFADMWELDTSNGEEFKWRQISTPSTKASPPPRARHCAVAVSCSATRLVLSCDRCFSPGVLTA
jgi:hypothetical protein